MTDIVLKQHDTGIGARATLSDKNGNVNLTDADVLFLFGKHAIQPVIKDALNGIVDVAFDEIHTAEHGFFDAEFQITYNDGRIETYPSDGYVKVYIMQDIGGN